MAWVVDTNFGSTHFATDAEAPFPTGGGNKILSLGAGVAYRDDILESALSINFDTVFRNVFGPSTTINEWHAGGPGVRNAAGDLYFARIGVGIKVADDSFFVGIFKYSQISDTFTQLTANELHVTIPSDSGATILSTLYSMGFAASGTSFSFLLNGASINSVEDSEFSGPWSPAITGQLGSATSIRTQIMHLDNFAIDSI